MWQKSHSLVLEIYRITRQFPVYERYGLTDQLRRASVSVSANIVESWKRRGVNDKKRFFNIAEASLEESRYLLLLAADLKYVERGECQKLLSEVSKLLHAYSKGIGNLIMK